MSRLPAISLAAAAAAVALTAVPASAASAASGPDGGPAVVTAPADLTPVLTVAPGDTLSGLALIVGRSWPALAAWNSLADPDLLEPGEQLRVPPADFAPPARNPVPVTDTTVHTSDAATATGFHPVTMAPASNTDPHPSQQKYPLPVATTTAASTSTSSFEACVIRRESGGNAQVVNGSGHWGLYQFSYSTWVANGGSPSSFGHASAAEQHAVFVRSAPSNWKPYDGC